MEIQKILSLCDHTLLSPTATWKDIQSICSEGMQYHTASVCIPASYVKQAARFVKNEVPICTVVGFPNGYATTASKCFETEEALKNGADEIDMVIHLGWLKDKKYKALLEEIRSVKSVCGAHILKVIVETCLLTKHEKIKMCEIVSESGADFIKTSTGFSTGGAQRSDIALFRANVSAHVQIKAAGGIAALEDAQAFLDLGATRLGTSRIVRIAKKLRMEQE